MLFLQYTLLGLILGGVYGIAASGLVLTYTTSGIFNFAHGAIAMLSAYIYWQVRVGWHWPAPLALFVVLFVFAPLLGAVLDVGIMRGLRNTSEITKITVTIALTIGAVPLANWIWNPLTPRRLDYFFGSNNSVSVFGSKVTYHEFIALGCAVIIALGLRFLFTRSYIGVAMRGVVDDPDLLRLNGGKPLRLATFSWALGAFLAALAGILITPILGGSLDPNQLTLLVIDAFAAAVFGRLRSVPRTFLGAVIIGLADNYVVGYLGNTPLVSHFRESLSMILLFIALLLLPSDRLRGASVIRARERFNVPSVRQAVMWAVILIVGMYLLRRLMAATALNDMNIGLGFALIALSLVPLTGYAGELNLAPLAFGAIGALVAFHNGVAGSTVNSYMTVWGLILAFVVCALVGGLVALPALRLRGLYLALGTMAFGVFVSHMLLEDSGDHVWFGQHFSIFTNGSLNVPAPKIGPIDARKPGTFLMFLTVLFAVLGVLIVLLRRSGFGQRLIAMKDSPAASATLGQNPIRLKLGVFMLSAGIAGLGGALLSAALVTIDINSFTIFSSLAIVMSVVIAGIGYVSGAFTGGLLFGVAYVAIQNSFGKIGTDHASLHGMFNWLATFTTVLPAIVGVGLGKNPSGFVSDIMNGFKPLTRAKPMIALGVGIEVGLYVLADTNTISNWWFVVGTILMMLLWPTIARLLMPGPFKADAEKAKSPLDVPLEQVGIDVPMTPELLAALDDELGIPAPTGEYSVTAATMTATASATEPATTKLATAAGD
jgi:branched-subunit amino acid ABC-type transport system permease component